MLEAEVIELLRSSDALLEGHFELSSGMHSERYFQCALLLADPRRAERLARALAERLPVQPEVVIGPALGAVIWAHEMARALGTPAIFSERKDGTMELRRGFRIRPGQSVLVVEDVITTGGSALVVLELVRAAGGVPLGVATVVNRCGGNPFADQDLELWALARLETPAFEPRACPACKRGERAVKPGSRPGSAVGS
jgi:orotate phosphoribosyltransferase